MSPEPVVPLSALEHHVYCPRQCALIHVDGVWADNVHVLRGSRGHQRVDGGEHRTERGRRVLRALPLWSEHLGLTGRADAVEVHDDGSVVPVEYKIGVRHGIAAHVQLTAQAFCLEEMLGYAVGEGAIWFSATRRREVVVLDAFLRKQTHEAIDEVRRWLRSDRLPPAPNDARCTECQLLGHCLPDIVADASRVSAYLKDIVRCMS